jgi:hypothetical protein
MQAVSTAGLSQHREKSEFNLDDQSLEIPDEKQDRGLVKAQLDELDAVEVSITKSGIIL